jgi:hypothetical protein
VKVVGGVLMGVATIIGAFFALMQAQGWSF